jgi:4-amino-4-deoxy-L-arabinose transferase-like glycosyltransferase
MIHNAVGRLRTMPDLVWITAITWLGFTVRLVYLDVPSLWADEAFTWLVTSQPLASGLELALVNFVHPPLYYLLLHPVTLFSHSEFVLRLPSVLLGTLGIPLIYRLGRELASEPGQARHTGLLAAGLLALNPFHVWFSRDARNYGLVFLLALLIFYTFQQLLQGQKRWGAFVIVSALAYITHYFALLLALAHFVYFLLNFRQSYRLFRRWVLAQAVAFIPLALWMVALFSQETKAIGIGWIPRPTWLTPLLTFWDFALLYAENWLPWGVIILPLFFIALAFGFRPRRWRTFLALWLLVPCLSILLISWILDRHFYVDRYLIISLPAFVLLLARGIVAFPGHSPSRRWMAASIALLLLSSSALSVTQVLYDPALAKTEWRNVGELLQAGYDEGDQVVLRIVEDTVPLHYYSPDPAWTCATNRPEPDPWPVIENNYRRLWLVWSSPHTTSHLPVSTMPFDIYTEADAATAAWLTAHQEDVIGEWHFAGLTILLVQLAPQRSILQETECLVAGVKEGTAR